MIIADSFLWLHLPKSGGTSMTRLFRDWNLPGIQIDPDDTPTKHDSVPLRESRGKWRAGSRQRFITARRLTAWLVSDWEHKRRHMHLPDLPFEPVRSGLTYSLRLGGTWVAADWWLQYFAADTDTTALRLEHLADDLNRELLPLLPAGTQAVRAPKLPRENAKPANNLSQPMFSSADLARIRAVNPRWSAWEEQVYVPQARP
ncbi:hypothetical protein [Synechococcus sp. J7-Johnson]|uniref:hypothetical protein n=1 Tax=Synechococcus sp. J7-Johnson TaxID=2823737 RepID=UPI0020CE1A5C|nr:hypothetical protein [Synechococcus sp. J7-Johnson]